MFRNGVSPRSELKWEPQANNGLWATQLVFICVIRFELFSFIIPLLSCLSHGNVDSHNKRREVDDE